MRITRAIEGDDFYRSANLKKIVTIEKISGSRNVNFRLGGPDPQSGGRGPQMPGALYRDPKGAHSGERTAAISVAVTEQIAIEKNSFSAL